MSLLLSHPHYGEYARAIEQGHVPEAFPGHVTPDVYQEVSPELPPVNWKLEMRSFQIRHGMFAIVDQAWTRDLAKRLTGKRVLEVMAGRGWLAKAMREHGIDWTATDDHSWWEDTVTEVEKLDAAQAVLRYRDEMDVLAFSWPPLNDPVIERVVSEWPRSKPIVYIGEGQYGCTGTPKLHEMLEADRSVFIDMPRYPRLADGVHWCRRKEAP